MPNLSSFKVNCATLTDTNISNIYNLGSSPLYAVDIFMYSRVADSIKWILTQNGDATPKIQLRFDDDQVFDIKAGLAGESFSNPISYSRTTDVGPNVMKVPTHNKTYQADISFIGGGMDSSAGSNWSYRFPVPSADSDMALQRQNPGINNDSLKMEILIGGSTDFLILNQYMANVTITVAPSLYRGLKHNYLNYDSEKETPVAVEKGVRY